MKREGMEQVNSGGVGYAGLKAPRTATRWEWFLTPFLLPYSLERFKMSRVDWSGLPAKYLRSASWKILFLLVAFMNNVMDDLNFRLSG